MKNVLGVKVIYDEKMYYVSYKIDNISVGDEVVASTSYGLKYATVNRIYDELDEKLIEGSIVRKATKNDKKDNEKNLIDQDKALSKCKELVKKLSLDMRLIRTEFSFDRAQLLIYFSAGGRIDFRDLAKQMASYYKTRIEFRQVGVRDKAKIVGGLGPCGRKLCCSTFLYDFDSISISMAKNQALALNPTKINGVCGRLLCCLKYEDEIYREFRKNIPNVGKRVMIDGKEAKVVQIDLYNQKYVVEFADKTQKEVLVDLDERDK